MKKHISEYSLKPSFMIGKFDVIHQKPKRFLIFWRDENNYAKTKVVKTYSQAIKWCKAQIKTNNL